MRIQPHQLKLTAVTLAALGLLASLAAVAVGTVAESPSIESPAALPPSLRYATGRGIPDAAVPFTRALPGPRATCINAPAGWSRRERLRPGTPDLPGADARLHPGQVTGYLDTTSAVCGQTVSVHLSTEHGPSKVRLRALRIGDYHGAGGRLVWESHLLVAHEMRQGVQTGPGRVIAEDWPVATRFTVTSGWPPGMYLIEIQPVEPTLGRSFIPLVVRTSGVRSTYLVVDSDLTWVAYNGYGGASLYLGHGNTHEEEVAKRSFVASTARPLGPSALVKLFPMDVPLLRFLDSHGLSADVTTDTALDADPSQLRGQTTVILPGHSEYWTKRMYDAAVAAQSAGTNFADLGANEIYWQARINRDVTGRVLAMTVYRDPRLDPATRTDPPLSTTRWTSWPLYRDPAQLVGVGMSAVGVRGDYLVRTAPPWLFAGTGLHVGSRLPGSIGNEADAQEPPGRHSPTNFQVLLHGVVVPNGGTSQKLVTAGYYTAPSGAGVFAAGTTEWVCELDGSCPEGPTPGRTVAALDRLTLNLLDAFSVPRAGLRHPSRATPYLSPASVSLLMATRA